MEVKKVYYHALDGVEHGVAVEVVLWVVKSVTDIFKVYASYLLLLLVQMHHWLFKQCQVSPYAIVALWGGNGNKVL